MFNSAKATDSSPPNHKLNSNLNSPVADRYRSKPHQAKSHAVSQNNSDDEPEANFVQKDQKKKLPKKQVDPNQTPKKRGRPAKICKSQSSNHKPQSCNDDDIIQS
jgi:hypothetical protein